MRTGQRRPVLWGLALSAAIHALLGLALLRALALPRPPQSRPGAVLSVALMAPAASAAGAPAAEAVPDSVAEAAPASAAEPVREELHYYGPDELDRQLIVLRDRSGDAEIDLHSEVVMNLYVDSEGRVVTITFEGEAPSATLQEQLRAAFMTMEFMPGMKQGRPVPARFKIGIAPVPAFTRVPLPAKAP